jgi:predicted secreted protein
VWNCSIQNLYAYDIALGREFVVQKFGTTKGKFLVMELKIDGPRLGAALFQKVIMK